MDHLKNRNGLIILNKLVDYIAHAKPRLSHKFLQKKNETFGKMIERLEINNFKFIFPHFNGSTITKKINNKTMKTMSSRHTSHIKNNPKLYIVNTIHDYP